VPFKSKAQWGKFFAMADRGEISFKKAKEWAKETKTPYKKLPKKVSKKDIRVEAAKRLRSNQ